MDHMMMNVIEEALVFVGLMASLGCVTKVILAMVQRRKMPMSALPPVLEEISQRLAHLEAAADTTAIEVERIAEGQRFTTKILVDRGAQRLPGTDPVRGRVITPH